MNKKILPWIVSIFVTIPYTFAFSFGEIFALVDIIDLYESAPHLWDTILFVVFFVALCKQFLAKRLSKPVAAVLGIILGLSLELFLLYPQGLTIAVFGPVAAAAFMLLFAVALYQIMQGALPFESGVLSKATAFVILLPAMMAIMPNSFEQWIETNELLAGVWGFIMFIWALCFFWVLYSFVMMGVGLWSSGGGGKDEDGDSESSGGSGGVFGGGGDSDKEEKKVDLGTLKQLLNDYGYLVQELVNTVSTIRALPRADRLEQFQRTPSADLTRFEGIEEQFEREYTAQLKNLGSFGNKKDLDKILNKFLDLVQAKSDELERLMAR